MLTESFTVPLAEVEATKVWYFSQYNPWAYQAQLTSSVPTDDGRITLTFTRASRC